MPLDRLSALRRALVPRIGHGLAFTSRTVHGLQHLTSPDSLDIRRRQNPLMPAVSALTVTHDSQPLPGLGVLAPAHPAQVCVQVSAVLGRIEDHQGVPLPFDPTNDWAVPVSGEVTDSTLTDHYAVMGECHNSEQPKSADDDRGSYPGNVFQHPSALRPAAANLSHDVVLSEVHDPHNQRHRPREQDQILTQRNPKKQHEHRKSDTEPPGNQTRPHDHSTLDNDSPDHPGRASPHSLPSPHPDSSEIREALLGHLGVRARAEPSPQISEPKTLTPQGSRDYPAIAYHVVFA